MCVYVSACVCVYVCVSACVCVCVYVSACVCVYVYVSVCPAGLLVESCWAHNPEDTSSDPRAGGKFLSIKIP